MGNISGNYTGIFVDNNGKVGIGNVLTPAFNVDICGNIHATNEIYIDGNIYALNTANSANTNSGSLVVSGGIGVAKDIWTNGNLYYGTSGFKMGNISGNYTGIFIDNSGKVGIGNMLTPAFNVDIIGNIHATNAIYIDGNIYARNTANSANTISGSLVVSGGVGVAKDIWTNGNLYYGTSGFKMGNISGNYTGVFMDNYGNVGIGNIMNPQSSLHINGVTTIGPILNNTNGKMRIYESSGTGPYIQTTSGATPTTFANSGTTGSLVINHNNSGGYSSILFTSNVNIGGDYSYIQYFDHVSGGSDNKSGLLMIGIENENGRPNYDRICLYPCAGSGYVGINNLNPAYNLDVTGTINSSSQISAQTFNARSDYRIKTNVVSINDLSFNVDVLRPVHYTNTIIHKEDFGFIAHEVQEHFPFLVSGEKDGEKMQSINYNGFIALLVKEIQELKKRVSELEKKQELEKNKN
jgi:hypothetical protein